MLDSAPDANMTPKYSVSEGIVYIGMTMSDLTEHIYGPDPHATTPASPTDPRDRGEEPVRRSFRWRQHAPRTRSTRASPERLTLADALRDPEIDAALTDRSYARGADDMHDLAHGASNLQEDLYAADFSGDVGDVACLEPVHSDLRYPNLTDDTSRSDMENGGRRVRIRRSRLRQFALLSDEEPGPEDSSPPGWAEYRLQRWRNMRRRQEIDNWDRDERWGGLNRLPPHPAARPGSTDELRDRPMSNLSRLDYLMARSELRDDEEDVMTPLSPPTPPHTYRRLSTGATLDPRRTLPSPPTRDEQASGLSSITRAHFRINESKHKVAIKFSTPVSGRFVLLKLWADPGCGKGNVDVQSVILKGYGGGRSFPSLQYR